MVPKPFFKTYFKTYQEDAIQAAEELMYGDKVIERLKKAKTEADICRIMATARNEKIKRQEMYGGNV